MARYSFEEKYKNKKYLVTISSHHYFEIYEEDPNPSRDDLMRKRVRLYKLTNKVVSNPTIWKSIYNADLPITLKNKKGKLYIYDYEECVDPDPTQGIADQIFQGFISYFLDEQKDS